MNVTRNILESFSNMIGVDCTQPEMQSVVHFVSDPHWAEFSKLILKKIDRTKNKVVGFIQCNDQHQAVIAAGNIEGLESVLSFERHVQAILNTKQETP